MSGIAGNHEAISCQAPQHLFKSLKPSPTLAISLEKSLHVYPAHFAILKKKR